jgi:hypothetical protein
MTRYDFGAIAAVIDLDSREDMIVVTRDLSLSGCFVKTRTPFPAGTEVRVRITYAGLDFAAIGSVTENITREGMGIEFVEIEPEHQAIIEGWLGVSAVDPDGRDARSRAVRVINRLTRQQHSPRVISVDRKPEAPRPTFVDNESSDPAWNLWDVRDDTRR